MGRRNRKKGADAPWEGGPAVTDSRLFLFGGKGGVGKTTCSAAIAVKLAADGLKTLHITTDMAPSLSDVYATRIGETLTRVAGNLDVIEISQDQIARIWKDKFGADFKEILEHLLDVEGLQQEGDLDLLDYIGTAPSLREETLLDFIVEMVRGGQYQRVIWDTAPAGETLKLLNMPRLMRQHLKAGAKVYEAVDRLTGKVKHRRNLGSIMEEWVVRSEGIARYLEDNTLFIIVTNPESLVVSQAERVMASLRGAGFSLRGMIINRIAVKDGSEFLDRMHRRQEPYIEQLQTLANGLPVAYLPFLLDEIRGLAPLWSLGEKLLEDLGLSFLGKCEEG